MSDEAEHNGQPVGAYGFSRDFPPLDGEWLSFPSHYLLYAADGVMRLRTENAQWLLPPQRAAWISANVRISVRSSSSIACRSILFSPDFIVAPSVECAVFAVTPLAREMILHAMRWGVDRDPADEMADHFFAALAALCREWIGEGCQFRLPRARSRELARAMEYTIEHLGGRPTFAGAAEAARLSERTLARRFEQEAQTSWRRFLQSARIMRAMELLAAAGSAVAEVAFDVGYESVAAFTTAFREFTGETPTAYRRRVVGSLRGAEPTTSRR